MIIKKLYCKNKYKNFFLVFVFCLLAIITTLPSSFNITAETHNEEKIEYEISQSINELLEYLSFYGQLEWQQAEAVRCSQWCLGGRIILAQAGVEAEDEAVSVGFFCVKNGSET